MHQDQGIDGSDKGESTCIERPLQVALRAALERAFGLHPRAFVVPAIMVGAGLALIAAFSFVPISLRWIVLVGFGAMLVGLVIAGSTCASRAKVRRDLDDGHYREWTGAIRVIHDPAQEGEECQAEIDGRLFNLSRGMSTGDFEYVADGLRAKWPQREGWQAIFPMRRDGWGWVVAAYLKHSGILVEIRTVNGSLLYCDSRIDPEVFGQSLR